MNRRNFITQSGIALTSASILAMTTKAFAQNKEQCPPEKKLPAIQSLVSANHSHEIVVPYEDVITGKTKTYDIKGKSSHSHFIEVTEEHLAILRVQKTVEITSSEDFGHAHKLTLVREVIG